MGALRRSLFLAHAAGVVSLAGVQAVAPALPAVQEALGLSDSQVALVISAYLMPSVVFAVPSDSWPTASVAARSTWER